MNGAKPVSSQAWTPASWRNRPAAQQPSYPDPAALACVLEELARLPPLVTSWEIEALKRHLSAAASGREFLLQGGDCSETFAECSSPTIIGKLKVLMQMSLVLSQGAKIPVIRVGRLAGQYAKPRSSDTETREGVALPSYRGDSVNRPGFTLQDRTPDPQLLLRAYERSALTMNFVRALVGSGFADLHHPEYWSFDFIRNSPRVAQYQAMVDAIQDSLRFWETVMGSKLREVDASFRILQGCGTHLGGVHFELTGEDVTECIGGATGVSEADLARDYRTAVDPRLNYDQALEMALLIARLLHGP